MTSHDHGRTEAISDLLTEIRGMSTAEILILVAVASARVPLAVGVGRGRVIRIHERRSLSRRATGRKSMRGSVPRRKYPRSVDVERGGVVSTCSGAVSMKHLHELLRELRGTQSVPEAAKAAGISANALYSIESAPGAPNYRRPSGETLGALLGAYKATPPQRAAALEAFVIAPESAPTRQAAPDIQGAA